MGGSRRHVWGQMLGGVGAFPLSHRLQGVGERPELPQRGSEQIPGRKLISVLFNVTECLLLK